MQFVHRNGIMEAFIDTVLALMIVFSLKMHSQILCRHGLYRLRQVSTLQSPQQFYAGFYIVLSLVCYSELWYKLCFSSNHLANTCTAGTIEYFVSTYTICILSCNKFLILLLTDFVQNKVLRFGTLYTILSGFSLRSIPNLQTVPLFTYFYYLINTPRRE
jgi:hypothetical protein